MYDDNPYSSSGDTGSGDVGLDLQSHITGNPLGHGSVRANVTVGHTVFIVAGGLVGLWALAWLFRHVRM